MSDGSVVAGAVLAVVAALAAPPLPPAVALLLVAAAAVLRRPEPLLLALVVLVAAHAHGSLAALDRPLPARVAGVAELASDPEPGRFGTRVVLRLDGRRWLASFDRATESMLRPLLTGDRIEVTGRPAPLRGVPEGWRRSRHLAGRLSVERAGPGPPPPPWYAVANGVHRVLRRGADSFGDRGRSLYLGLVIGDDRGQDDLDRFRFRASGLGHLLAVSGQNVAFLMVVAAPVMSRLGLRGRWLVGVAVLVLFVLVTRAEPSVLRAAAMAGLTLTAATAGRVASGARILSVAVGVLVLADPLLVHSVGFRLSVGATAGLLLLTRPLAARLPGPRRLADPLATTLAAQAGTAPFLLGLSGGLPAVGVVANLLAVPAAGAVMVLGLSVGLLAGLLRSGPASVLQVPARVLVAWVDAVATVSSRVPVIPLDGVRLLLLVLVAALLAAILRGAGRRARVPAVALAVASAAALVAPVPPGAGRHAVGPDVTLEVDRCDRRTVVVGPSARTLDALSGLWRLGVAGADAVVVPGGRSSAVAAELAEQLRAPVTTQLGGACRDGRVASPP